MSSAKLFRIPVLLFLLLLSGCITSLSQPPSWAPVPPPQYVAAGRAQPVLVIDVPLSQIPMYCGNYDHGVALACALQSLTTGFWVIYTSSREPWVMDHEYAHVASWEHG